LKHPNIVNLIGITYSDEVVFGARIPGLMVMELADSSLQQLLEMLAKEGKRLDPKQLNRICSNILAGLQHLHSLGIVHRDLKPANCLSFFDGAVYKISYLGIARMVRSDLATMSKVGTPQYIAPEIETGHYGVEVDVYSFGVMLAEMIALKPMSITNKHVRRETLMLAKTRAPHLAPLIDSCIDDDPSKRPTPAAALAFFPPCDGEVDGGGGADVEPMCVICLERPVAATLVHADGTGHKCCCVDCSGAYRGKPCPICRQQVVAVLHKEF
jgi:serine/threonine protein kinase